MPPASRAVSGNVAAACLRQWARVADAIDELPPPALTILTRIPGWRLPHLVIHLTRCLDEARIRLAEAAPATVEVDVPQYALLSATGADVLSACERESADGRTPAELKAALRVAIAQFEQHLNIVEAARLVTTAFGAMRLNDFIVTRCIEGVVHGLDLSAAVPGLPLSPDPEALRITAKALLATLAAKAPGKAVEVRVPPVAAVQCVEGPRHTRGTPPNVVETDPISWIELAAGRLTWREVTEDGRLRASGERSDISGLLPLW
jgi:uncharacterized protein (TIGR03083 family)